MNAGTDDHCQRVSWLAPVPESQEERVCDLGECPRRPEEGEKQSSLPPQEGKGDRWGQDSVKLFQVVRLSFSALVTSKELPQDGKEDDGVDQRDSEKPQKAERSEEHSQPL